MLEHQVPEGPSSSLAHCRVRAPQQGHQSGDTSKLQNLGWVCLRQKHYKPVFVSLCQWVNNIINSFKESKQLSDCLHPFPKGRLQLLQRAATTVLQLHDSPD